VKDRKEREKKEDVSIQDSRIAYAAAVEDGYSQQQLRHERRW
jgi:hypothetical protein